MENINFYYIFCLSIVAILSLYFLMKSVAFGTIIRLTTALVLIIFIVGATVLPLNHNAPDDYSPYFMSFVPIANFKSTVSFYSKRLLQVPHLSLVARTSVLDFSFSVSFSAIVYPLPHSRKIGALIACAVPLFIIIIKIILYTNMIISFTSIFDTIEFVIVTLGSLFGIGFSHYIQNRR